MLIALLAVLGVDLIVILVVLASVLAHRRWVNHQPGAFRGSIRIADGEIDGLGPKWSRGYGRWVRDVLVWTKAPFLFRNEVLPADGVDGHTARRVLARSSVSAITWSWCESGSAARRPRLRLVRRIAGSSLARTAMRLSRRRSLSRVAKGPMSAAAPARTRSVIRSG
jgi:hypothetical protein